MDEFNDSNSSSMFEDTFPNNNHNRNMEGLSGPSVSNKEDSEEALRNRPTSKINFHSVSKLPKVAVAEKIVICIENSQEKGLGYTFTDFDQKNNESDTYAIRNEAIRMFMVNKLDIAKDTEFAIVSLEPGKLNRLSHFTSNITKLSKSLREYKLVFNDEPNVLDISSIFSDLLKFFDIPEWSNVTIMPPNHIVRVIFVYSNSFCTLNVNKDDPSYTKLMLSPGFFFDVLYLHEKQSDFNNVVRIYQELGEIVTPSSYLLESSRDVTKVFNCIMKLLAHPNQRVAETKLKF